MSRPENPSALHILCFVYLTFSHCTDGELAREELETIARVLQAWVPDAPAGAIQRVSPPPGSTTSKATTPASPRPRSTPTSCARA